MAEPAMPLLGSIVSTILKSQTSFISYSSHPLRANIAPKVRKHLGGPKRGIDTYE
jgi:hypothetical protein